MKFDKIPELKQQIRHRTLIQVIGIQVRDDNLQHVHQQIGNKLMIF
jgi:hypothetical protein